MRAVSGVSMLSIALATCLIPASLPASGADCEGLTSLSLPNTTITLAQSYAADETVSGSTTAPVDLCRVAGKVKPGSG